MNALRERRRERKEVSEYNKKNATQSRWVDGMSMQGQTK
jgi:hypothetical protein